MQLSNRRPQNAVQLRRFSLHNATWRIKENSRYKNKSLYYTRIYETESTTAKRDWTCIIDAFYEFLTTWNTCALVFWNAPGTLSGNETQATMHVSRPCMEYSECRGKRRQNIKLRRTVNDTLHGKYTRGQKKNRSDRHRRRHRGDEGIDPPTFIQALLVLLFLGGLSPREQNIF
jgi:hypothetical protein